MAKITKDIFPLKYLRYYLIAGIFENLLSFLYLLLIPVDPKNSWFMGYSLSRITLALVLVAFGFIHAGLITWQKRKGGIYTWINPRITKLIWTYGFAIPIFIFACSFVFFGTFLNILASTPTMTTLQGYMLRVAPFMLFLGTRVIQTVIIFILMGLRVRKQKGQQNKESKNTIVVSPSKIGVILGFIAIFLVIASIGVETISRFTWDSRIIGLGPRF